MVGLGDRPDPVSVQLFARWVIHWSGRLIESRFQAAQSIAHQERVPQGWLRSFRRRMDAIRRAGGSADQVEQVRRGAQEGCLKLDALILLFGGGIFAGSSAVQQTLMQALPEQGKRWASGQCNGLMEMSREEPGNVDRCPSCLACSLTTPLH